jgi:hypothetical protein
MLADLAIKPPAMQVPGSSPRTILRSLPDMRAQAEMIDINLVLSPARAASRWAC